VHQIYVPQCPVPTVPSISKIQLQITVSSQRITVLNFEFEKHAEKCRRVYQLETTGAHLKDRLVAFGRNRIDLL
jgi:hypothetical protein